MPRPRMRLPEWLFGSGGKLRLLQALFEAPRETVWRQVELARAAELGPKGSADEHLLALVQIGLIRRDGAGYALDDRSTLVEPLDRLLEALREIPDEPLTRPS